MEDQQKHKVENIMRDTRKNVRYIILASRKLTRNEMLQVIRLFNYDPQNLKAKPNSTIVIESDF
jgi:hypothetical protein